MFTCEFATVYYKQSTKGWDSSYWKDYNLSAVDGGDDNVDKSGEGQGDSPQKDNGGTSGRIPGGVTQRPGTGGTSSGGTGGGGIQPPRDTKEGEEEDIDIPEKIKDEDGSGELKPTFIKSVKKKKNKLVITFKKVASVSGYEITYRRKKKEKAKTITISGWKNNVVILRKLKKGKYWIKVRTYAERNGKRYYSKYSRLYKLKA